MSVAPAHDERQRRQRHWSCRTFGFDDYGVNVALQVVHCDEWKATDKAERLRISNPDEQRSDQSGTFRNGDRVQIGKRDLRCLESRANHWHDRTQMLTRGELGHDAAVFAMRLQLRGDDRGENPRAVLHDGSSGFITRGLDAENAHEKRPASSLQWQEDAPRSIRLRSAGGTDRTGTA